jgi:tetratricopeptide (TPR) repeat protein
VKNLPGQELDDPVEPLVPKKPRTAEEQNRLDAMAHYMTGQLLEQRSEFPQALDAYKKAIALDPKSVQIYRALVPLAFSQNQTDEAVKYALKAIELDPDDYQLLRRLGIHMANQRQIPQAIELLIKAVESPELKDNKAMLVMLHRDLAMMYSAIGEKAKAADAFEVVFEALNDPEKFGLNFRQQKSLESNPATTYEQIGQSFIDAERPELAVKAFEAALKARRGKPGTLSYNLAQAYLQIKQHDKALEELQKYFDAQLQTKGRAAYELLAEIMKAKGQEPELITRLEKMAQDDARNTTLQYFLAEQYLEGNQLDKAEALYKKTLDGAKDPEGYAGLASVYRRQNKPGELLDALAQAIDAGSPIEALDEEIQAIGGDEKLAVRVIDLAKKQAADNNLKYAAARIAGKIAASAKKTEDALAMFELAMQDRREFSDDLYEDIGGMYFDAENFAKAAEWYRKAVNDPATKNKPQYLYRLSQVEELGGNTEAALAALKQALDQLPEVRCLGPCQPHFSGLSYDD